MGNKSPQMTESTRNFFSSPPPPPFDDELPPPPPDEEFGMDVPPPPSDEYSMAKDSPMSRTVPSHSLPRAPIPPAPVHDRHPSIAVPQAPGKLRYQQISSVT